VYADSVCSESGETFEKNRRNAVEFGIEKFIAGNNLRAF